ncbi:MAG: hypothetical protein HFI33_09495 [Lachnospiraceae bacterium]|nr:hypothetical protein [Lachnospiraceae bacterium]
MRNWNETCKKRRGRRGLRGYVLVGSLLLLLVGASRRLPAYFLSWQDEQQVGRKEVWQVTEVTLKAQESLSLSEKIKMPFHASVKSLALENGRHYTQETIGEKVREELKKLEELGILMNCQWEDLVVQGAVNFYMNTENSEESVMLWIGEAIQEEYFFNWIMDDESGKILEIAQIPVGNPDSRVSSVVSRGNSTIYDVQEDITYDSDIPDKGIPVFSKEQLEEIMKAWGTYLECEFEDAAFWTGPGGDMGEEIIRKMENSVMELQEKGYSGYEAYCMVLAEEGYGDINELKYVGVFQDAKGSITYSLQGNIRDGTLHLFAEEKKS